MLIAMLLAAALMVGSSAPAPGQGEVAFVFRGLQPRGGVLAAVYASEAAYKAHRGPVARARARVEPDGRAMVRLGRLPPGRYAALLFHDVDGDGRLDLGREPYGSSNNARGLFGPPSWCAAAFTVGSASVRQEVVLRGGGRAKVD